MCSENGACYNSGNSPNFYKIKYSSLSAATATYTLVALAAVPEAGTKTSNETTIDSAALSNCEASPTPFPKPTTAISLQFS